MIQPKHNDIKHVAHRKLDKLQVYYSDRRLNQSEAFVGANISGRHFIFLKKTNAANVPIRFTEKL
jgi:hypothetical protein